jgi:ABC-type spermidine/putrescine transport system permease subunit II
MTGLSLTYIYFQFPLMILIIAPSLEGPRKEWREAAENLGASPGQYWRHIGFPVLLPALLGAMVLLFGNAFSAYATAVALSGGSIFWLVVGALYFLVPLYSLVQFSLETGRHRYGFAWYTQIFGDPLFRSSFIFSLRLAVETVIISMVLMVPTVYWVHLRVPRLRPTMELISVLPFVVPPVALVVGLNGVFSVAPWLLGSSQILALVYVVLALPFTYRSLDAGMRAIDIKTLTEAAQSVGSPGWKTL